MSIELETLVRHRAQQPDATQFFLAKDTGAKWLKSIMPGINAAQKLLDEMKLSGLLQLFMDPETIEEKNRTFSAMTLLKEENKALKEKLSGHHFDSIEVEKINENRVSEQEAISSLTLSNPAPGALEPLAEKLRDRVDVPMGATHEQILKSVIDGRWSRRVTMLLPSNRDINTHVVYSMLAQIRRCPWMGFSYVADTVLQRARNICAHKFLRSNSEWSYWIDSDVIAPFKDPGFFYDHPVYASPSRIKPQFLNVMAAERLLQAGKTIVGAVYQQRSANPKAKMVIQPDLHPRNPTDTDIVRGLKENGPRDEVIEVGYVAFGCTLVHRSVFEDIMKSNPDRAPLNPDEPFDFFGHDCGKEGEDIAFSKLAIKSGHKCWLDLGLWCAHIGNYPYLP